MLLLLEYVFSGLVPLLEERHLKEWDLQITISTNDVGVFVALADLHNSIDESGAKTPPMQINAAAWFWANPSLFISQMKREKLPAPRPFRDPVNTRSADQTEAVLWYL